MSSFDSGPDTVSEFFEHDHRRLDQSFASYRELKDSNLSEAKDHFMTFYEELMTHIEWEEEVMFPVFEAKMGEGLTGTMRREHEQIEDVLESIKQELEQGNPPENCIDEKLLKFLEPHNDAEETVVYPAIDRHLSDEEIQQIFDRL
jgi:hemerythrin superfamily protein